jgi:hypothetical protein
MSSVSHRAEVEALIRNATEAGLLAAAHHYRNRMIEVLLPGYTSGAFSQKLLGVAGNVNVSQVQETPDGMEVQVGSNQTSDMGAPYPLFWEIGHLNLFTRRFEHQPRWEPTLVQELSVMRDKFAAAFQLVAQQATGFARVDVVARAPQIGGGA